MVNKQPRIYLNQNVTPETILQDYAELMDIADYKKKFDIITGCNPNDQ